jgi:phosphate uptake regulator
MRRRIIKQGAGGSTIFLPIAWVRKNSLAPGAEVEVDERDGGLFVSAEKGEEKREIRLDITGLSAKTIRHIIIQAYTAGYTEVQLSFKDRTIRDIKHRYIKKLKPSSKAAEEHPTIDFIFGVARELIGYEIVEHRQNFVRIRQISKVDEEEFKTTLRRIYLLQKELNESLASEMGKARFDPDEIYRKIDTFHRFTNYAVRLLKCRVVSKDQFDLYEVIMRFDNIASSYRYAARFLAELRGKREQNTLAMIEGLGKLITLCYEAQYGFSYEKYDQYDDTLQSLYYLHNSTYATAGKADIRVRQIIAACYMELTVVMKSILAMNMKN